MTRKRTPVWLSALLWLLAVILMLAAVIYQRRTGPTYPYRGEVTAQGESERYKLVRSEYTTTDARVAVPQLSSGVDGVVLYKRYKTDDAFARLDLVEETQEGKREMVAYLPAQPAAGKLEYYVELETTDGALRIPAADAEDNIIIRFKDPVPGPLLWSHVMFMFFSVLIGMRTGLAALFAPGGVRPLAWTTFTGLTLGGMILGPFVQKYAFGEYWTGFPWGYDLTDNKMLIMWVAWLIACTTLGFRARKKESVGRMVVIVAALVMTVVYLIPHSMRGSELDYSKLEEGVPASEAIGTGD